MMTAINMDIREEWREITFLKSRREFRFEASNYGRIRRVSNVSIKIYRLKPSKIGYVYVPVPGAGKMSVHRIIARVFMPNPRNLRSVNHKNGDKTNNSVANLEWVSDSENTIHAIRTGLSKLPKMCLDLQTGIFYQTIKEAACAKQIAYTTVISQIKSKRNKSLIVLV